MSGDSKDEVIAQLTSTLVEQSATIQKLTAEISELKRLLFGPSRERVIPVERELRSRGKTSKLTPEQRQTRRREKRREQKQARESLPVEDVIHTLDACPACGSVALAAIAEKVNTGLGLVPAPYRRLRHGREPRRCRGCDTVGTAPGPDGVVDGVTFGPVFTHTRWFPSVPIRYRFIVSPRASSATVFR